MTQRYYEVAESEATAFLNYVSDEEVRHANNAENARTWNWHSPPEWPKIHLKTISTYHGKSLKRVDLTTKAKGIAFSPRAFDVLAPFLQIGGVILPLDVDDSEIWSFFFMDLSGDNIPFAKVVSQGVLRRDRANMLKPLPKTPKEGILPWQRRKQEGADFINWYEFDPESIAGRDVFLAAYGYDFIESVGMTLPELKKFVSDRFVRSALDAGLQGIDFIAASKPEDPTWQADLANSPPWH